MRTSSPLRRSPLKKCSNRVRRESALSDKQQRVLDRFWARFYAARTDEGRLNLLRSMADRSKGKRTASRYHFDRMKSKLTLRNKPCGVCDESATERHHIIPLDKGGKNCKQNLIPLCGSCHVQIHP